MALPLIAAGIAARAVAKKLATRAAGGIVGAGAKQVNPVYRNSSSVKIQNIKEDQQVIEGKSPEENGVKISHENEHIQKYCDYVSIIDKSAFSEYADWFKFQRASANILIPFDIYDKFMIFTNTRWCDNFL